MDRRNGMILCSEKEAKNNFKEIIYDLEGFDQDGFNRDGLDVHGFDSVGFTREDLNRNKDLIDFDMQYKKAIAKNPWIIYYAKVKDKDSDEKMKKCIEMKTIN